MAKDKPNPQQNTVPFVVDHVVDYYRRYPGEAVTFYTRVQVRQPLPDFTLRITIPEGLTFGDYRTLSDDGKTLPEIEIGTEASYFVWREARDIEAGTSYEYQVEAQIAPTDRDLTLESRAVVTAQGPDGETISAEETVAIAVFAKGQYLKYLPAIYQSDDFMGRFLMLFESFWGPIERQIDSIPFYFDPDTAPPDFLPWLASWLDLAFDERWPEEKRRRLLRCVASLYRKRGTKAGLQEHLEIFSGGQVEIIEHRAGNFRLGPEARLGPGIALGTTNVAHTFTVIVRLPLISTSPTLRQPFDRAQDEAQDTAGDGRDQEAVTCRMIETIIEAEKPGHTGYTLQLAPLLRHRNPSLQMEKQKQSR